MRKKSSQLTLKDVASILNVSAATISNAFNRPNQLSIELRQSILDECTKLNYYGPNAAARSLRTGRTGIVGVMLSNYLSYSFSDPVASQFLQGLAEVFEKKEYSLLVIPSRDNLKHVRGTESFVDGFIVYGPPERSKLEELDSQNKSIITVDFQFKHHVSVNINNYEAAKKCALHALKDSPKYASIIGLRVDNSNRVHRLDKESIGYREDNITTQRLQGYLDAAKEMNVEIPAQRIINVHDNTHDLGCHAARELLMAKERPEVLLCMSDRLALAAVEAARLQGLKVPEDILITGFDDIPQAAINFPSITTVHQQSIDKGRIAAEIFLGVKEEKSVLLPAELVIRQSCP